MKNTAAAALLFAFGYCAIYVLGQPLAARSAPLSQFWATAFYPLQRIQFRNLYSGVAVETGVIQQATDGDWGLTYTTPKIRPGSTPTQGISFRVPSRLAKAVADTRGRAVNVTIGKEPDLRHFGFANYVLTSVTLLPENRAESYVSGSPRSRAISLDLLWERQTVGI